MKPDVVRCGCCGFQVLASELDENGNGPCCPSSTRKPRSDKGTSRSEERINKKDNAETVSMERAVGRESAAQLTLELK